ncbi:MAG TPA: galactokinase family protein [Vicinamibacterales bacterium]|jgi:galactokinase|nr:galactokinase family protein [Vicinamibacterales bacterium]
MTGSRLAAALVERGLDEVDRPSIAELFDRVLAAARPDRGWSHAWWTPGRLEVFGTHTDYAGGRSVVCAVPKGIALAARSRDDDSFAVEDVAVRESALIAAGTEPSVFSGWRRYIATATGRLWRNFPGAVRGCDVAFESTLPRASGMSSSSALIVAVSAAVVELNGLHEDPRWVANIRSPLDVARYFACIENGRSFGTLTGDAGVGTHGGSEDHAAILTGRPSAVTGFRFAPMTRLDDVILPAAWRFVIAPSGVRAEKTGSAQASYNHLADQVQALLDLWNQHEPLAASLADAIHRGPGAVERLKAIVGRAPLTDAEVESLTRRLEHLVREDRIVADALDAVRRADAARIGDLSSESQAIAESLLRNQVPETIRLAAEARRLGAFAARSFGAGFGGSVWALVDAASAPQFAAAWHRDAFIMRPGPAHARL